MGPYRDATALHQRPPRLPLTLIGAAIRLLVAQLSEQVLRWHILRCSGTTRWAGSWNEARGRASLPGASSLPSGAT
jgi:hypothetical protein